jgi:2-polyprenyl-3-methyl-5-hydroxy-6-metoxy-1,4-benzoquinol methylase
MKYKLRDKCLSCNSKNLKEIINLGLHSFADRFIYKKNLKNKDPKYPLILDLCINCKFIQSRTITDPKKRYSEIDYSYTSSNSNYSKKHWKDFAKKIDRELNVKGKTLYEIGSNDGFLLHKFKLMGANVLGIDASKFMTKISKKKVNTINCIFNFNQSKKIKKKFGQADIIIANNVFNHSDNPRNFLKGIYNLLKKESIFIFEQPYFAKGLYSFKFDQIYHEHISYFTSKNIKSLLEKNNFKIVSMKKNGYHGGSLRTTCVKKISNIKVNKIDRLINSEKKNKIYEISYYKKFNQKINFDKSKLINKINQFKKSGYKIAGIGAGAKSNTFLTFYNFNNKLIDFLTDTSKYKINKYTPLTRIPIKSDLELKKHKKLICIILSWNISKIIVYKIKKLNKKIKIIYR